MLEGKTAIIDVGNVDLLSPKPLTYKASLHKHYMMKLLKN